MKEIALRSYKPSFGSRKYLAPPDLRKYREGPQPNGYPLHEPPPGGRPWGAPKGAPAAAGGRDLGLHLSCYNGEIWDKKMNEPPQP